MKIALTLFILAVVSIHAQAETYFVKIDSMKYMKLKPGFQYKIKTAGVIEKLTFQKISGDTFIFNEKKMHYQQITAFRNKKRKDVLDAIAYPVTIGSCVAMSGFPIAYFSGYFRNDNKGILKAVGFLVAETVIFYTARNYLGTNKRWVDFSKIKKLESKSV